MMRQAVAVAAGLGCLAAIPAALVTGHLLLALGLGLLGGGLVILGTVTPARGWGRVSRRPAGERLGHRHDNPRHRRGDWQTDRDSPPDQQGGWPDGRRPPLRDNLTEET